MPLETSVRIVQALTEHGYNAEREAVTLLAGSRDPDSALARAVETAPDDAPKLTAEHVRRVIESESEYEAEDSDTRDGSGNVTSNRNSSPVPNSGPGCPPVSTGPESTRDGDSSDNSPVETRGSNGSADAGRRSIEIAGDVTGRSTGTGEYEDFVAVFRDRYERLSKTLRSRVNHRPTSAIRSLPGGSETGLVGMVAEIDTTAGGHWRIELEDTEGTFPCLVLSDRDVADLVGELLHDEVIAVQGTVSDDGTILFVDDLHFPDVPRTHRPETADRHVRAALVSDLHVGSQEFDAGAWSRFADWLHSEAAEAIEYLLVAGDMVEGVGIYPDQEAELTIVDIYEQYEAFSERLKEVPGDLEIVMIPGNHDAVRLAEPQPAFEAELREVMSAHDAHVVGNPSTVDLEGVTVLLYHGVSLDEVIAELPAGKASYDDPQWAMYQLLKKRHLAPQFGGETRLAPEKRDYLVVREVPDVFHAGHVHKLGYGTYRNVLAVNSGCWQAQTSFQRSVNIDPDVGFAPVVDLDTLELSVYQFT